MNLPIFSDINAANIPAKIDSLLKENRQTIKTISEQTGPIHWDNLVLPLETIDDQLHQYWSLVNHMNSVVNTPELREAYNKCLPSLTDYSTEIGQNEKLFHAYEKLAEKSQSAHLDSAQQKLVKDAIRNFKLAGVNLPDDKKKQYKKLKQQLSKLTTKFEENLLDATKAWTRHVTDKKELTGLPDTAIAAAKQAAKQHNKEGWLFTLEIPSYMAAITYADSRDLRKDMYYAFSTRASDQGPNAGKFDNSDVINQILDCRLQLAKLLGYENYAELSLVPKMAESTQEVFTFLNDLIQAGHSQAQKEFSELNEFAKQLDGIEKLEAWDISYYSEKLRKERYDISQEELRPYFPEQQVIDGLFSVVNKLFGLRIKEKTNIDVWHKDVRFFEIFDQSNQLRAGFYIDLYARPNKRGGAWMDYCRGRRLLNGGTPQLPIAFLTCNLSPPVGDDPALFTHDEVITLFHEFGHGIHHMLTTINYADVAGMNGVPWDAVELPSQFLENWCWEREALNLFAKHYKTGELLPEDLFDKMNAAKNFQSAMQLMRQLQFSLFDLRIHSEFDPSKKNQVQQILNELRQQVDVVPVPEFNRFQHGFSHIFAGGYAAGYYSYKWAEVLASDAYSKFEENGIFDATTGQQFLHSILEKGGSAEPMDLFVEFRGRKPSIDALLRHTGIHG